MKGTSKILSSRHFWGQDLERIWAEIEAEYGLDGTRVSPPSGLAVAIAKVGSRHFLGFAWRWRLREGWIESSRGEARRMAREVFTRRTLGGTIQGYRIVGTCWEHNGLFIPKVVAEWAIEVIRKPLRNWRE